jgi:hypothetical protein
MILTYYPTNPLKWKITNMKKSLMQVYDMDFEITQKAHSKSSQHGFTFICILAYFIMFHSTKLLLCIFAVRSIH